MPKIRYLSSNMVLNMHYNASYLSTPKAQSHASGYFSLVASPLTLLQSSPMVPSISLAPFSNLPQHPPLMPNSVYSFSMLKKLTSSNLSLRNLATHHCLRPSTMTTPSLLGLSTTLSNNYGHEQWICGSFAFGYLTAELIYKSLCVLSKLVLSKGYNGGQNDVHWCETANNIQIN